MGISLSSIPGPSIPWLRKRIDLNHGVIIVLAAATCLLALLVAGCSSDHPGLPNIYLTAFSYQRTAPKSKPAIPQTLNSTFLSLVGNASMSIRAGYFGICIRSGNEHWTCHKNANSFASIVNVTQDPLNLVSNSIIFRDSIIFSGLIFISTAIGVVCILLLATFPAWHEEIDETGSARDVKRFPSRALTHSICAFLAAAILFALLSALWQHTAAVAFATAVQNMAYGSVKSEVGAMAIGLGWASLALYIVAFCVVLVQILSIKFLDTLTDD